MSEASKKPPGQLYADAINHYENGDYELADKMFEDLVTYTLKFFPYV